MILKCIVCNKEFIRFGEMALKAKTCSKKCLKVLKTAPPNTTCSYCGNSFHIKESQKKRYKRNQGYFCSTICLATFRKVAYLGANNPNFRPQVDRCTGGYKLTYLPRTGRIRIHHLITFEILGINKLPKGYCVHHRDCNVDNNLPDNLVLITSSDHRWLHKQFGNAALWAFYNQKITLPTLLEWTNDVERAKRLLPLNLLSQQISGVFKSGELLENLEMKLDEK